MSYLRKLTRAKRNPAKVDRIFALRAARFHSEGGWCGEGIGEDDPVLAVGARVNADVDLSLVEGRLIELTLGVSGKPVLAAVAAFDSDANAEGKVCGKQDLTRARDSVTERA